MGSSKKTSQHILEAQKLNKEFGPKKVVQDVSLLVRSREVVGLLGPNGAGKTTSFYMIVGLVSPDSGRVLLDEKDITQEPMHKRARLGIGYLPQNMSIFKKLTVEENLLAVMEVVGVPKSQRREQLDQLLTSFHISHIAKTQGIALSGGERRRVEIARTLIPNPDFLLLDEPFAGIDPVTVQEVQQVIKSLQKRNIGILITDHNVRETLGICDRAYVLSSGCVIAHGDPLTIAQDGVVRRIYLGDNFSL